MPRKETVTKIIDGDTFETSRRKRPVRLANVDAPEKRQPGYQQAKAKLAQLIGGKQVTVDTVARDPYRRAVAKVKADAKSINRQVKRKKS